MSILLAPALLRWVPPEHEALRLLLMAVGSTTAGLALSLAVGSESMDRLQLFYERVRPPGFWGPLAVAAGGKPHEGLRRLGRGLAATGLGSFSIFCVLAGLGTGLAGSLGPTWWPLGHASWVAVQLLAGLGLVPVWWRLGFARQ